MARSVMLKELVKEVFQEKKNVIGKNLNKYKEIRSGKNNG